MSTSPLSRFPLHLTGSPGFIEGMLKNVDQYTPSPDSIPPLTVLTLAALPTDETQTGGRLSLREFFQLGSDLRNAAENPLSENQLSTLTEEQREVYRSNIENQKPDRQLQKIAYAYLNTKIPRFPNLDELFLDNTPIDKWFFTSNNPKDHEYLLQCGCNPNAIVMDGRSLLNNAAYYGYTETVQALIDARADLESRDNYARSPLNNAARWGYTETVQALIDAGVDLESKDIEGRTPLNNAAYFCRTDIAQALIDAGAKLDSRDKSGRTPLDTAT